MSKIQYIDIKTEKRNQFVDITDRVQRIVDDSKVAEGLAELFVLHTTAAITINENTDPSVKSDIISHLEKMVPESGNYEHSEGNSDAHIKSSLAGTHQSVLIADGKIVLGTWQGIYFCEFDGPRSRRVAMKIIAD
jgi:secondary thiamine-phosphate synthase enzyme